MKKRVILNNKEYNIECEDSMCVECIYKPVIPEQKCKLFDVLLDHLVNDCSSNSGWKRCNKCIDAEVH